MMGLWKRSNRLDPAYLTIKSVALQLRKKADALGLWQQITSDLWLNDERRDDMAPDLRLLFLADLRWDLGETMGFLEGAAKKLDRLLEEMA